ncbi:MAG: hypothetical protein A2289_22885 [Deltaproteobacteria bacterium RIFOXYA12_FULL_58_15]|nr:MAG: hypothetical protein A2289_22885 [Deltaproteobacteria bacterium RIFOXYA12_FULL_58_15]OGR10018.1 MAG: hypothetical protein A2341_05525 [Deltaproteobacteria bacterium RIFOXYB12_FULL_58_9]
MLHPWLLAGLVGASLPVIIHLIGRRRAPTIRFAAFDFLLTVNKRLARRERLRQFLLLLLRTLAVIALVLAVARPVPSRPANAAQASTRHLGLIVDTSQSMSYVHDGIPLMQIAKAKVSDLLSHVRPGDSVAVVFVGAEVVSPFSTPTLDVAAVRAAVDALGEPAGVANIGAAIDKVLVLLGDDAAGATLVIVGDLSRNGFSDLRPTSIDPSPEVRLVDAAEREGTVALENLGVESVVVEHSQETPSERILRVSVHNWGGHAIERRVIELVIDERVTQRGYVQVPARGATIKTLTQLFDGAGVFTGTVRLGTDNADGYTVDDQASFVTVVAPGVEVLAIDGDARTTPYEDELFFVERAMNAIPKGDPPIRLRIITVDEVREPETSLELEGIDVVLLANVGDLPDDRIAELRRFVNTGGGLLIAPGDEVHFERANKVFADLLAHPLRDMHKAADPDAGTPPLGMGEIDWTHPVVAGLGLAAEESLRASRTSVYFNLAAGVGTDARAILRFDNGAPALVERSLGDGRLMLSATTLDVDWSDLPLRSVFPALLQRAVRYLARANDVLTTGTARVGDVIEKPVPTGARKVAWVGPNGVRREVPITQGQHQVRLENLGTGVHRGQIIVEGSDDWKDVLPLDVAVNANLAESDFLPVSTEQIAEAMGGDREGPGIAVSVGDSDGGEDPFEARGAATYLLIALAMFFVAESLLASRG